MIELMVRRFLYYPSRIPREAPLPPYCADAQEVWFETSRGDSIHGLYWPPAHDEPTILFFHGNAQTVFEWALIREELEAVRAGMLLIDYPGYGKSTGKPSEEALYAAGLSAWGFLQREGTAPGEIVIFGKSLGGGVATEVARDKRGPGRQPKALVLESTFTSIPSVARVLLPLIPTDALFSRERYESISKLEAIHCPVMVIHGTEDRLIPADEGRALFEGASPPKELFLVEGAGHNNVAMVARKEYGRRLAQWLDSLPPCPAPE